MGSSGNCRLMFKRTECSIYLLSFTEGGDKRRKKAISLTRKERNLFISKAAFLTIDYLLLFNNFAKTLTCLNSTELFLQEIRLRNKIMLREYKMF